VASGPSKLGVNEWQDRDDDRVGPRPGERGHGFIVPLQKKSRQDAGATKWGRVEARPVPPGGAGDEGVSWLLNVGAEAPTP